jgi:hypothetical protein
VERDHLLQHPHYILIEIKNTKRGGHNQNLKKKKQKIKTEKPRKPDKEQLTFS